MKRYDVLAEFIVFADTEQEAITKLRNWLESATKHGDVALHGIEDAEEDEEYTAHSS
jgi:hypothetical protein